MSYSKVIDHREFNNISSDAIEHLEIVINIYLSYEMINNYIDRDMGLKEFQIKLTLEKMWDNIESLIRQYNKPNHNEVEKLYVYVLYQDLPQSPTYDVLRFRLYTSVR